MVRFMLSLVLLSQLAACSYESRVGLANALHNAAGRVQNSTTCTTTTYRVKGGYQSYSTCY